MSKCMVTFSLGELHVHTTPLHLLPISLNMGTEEVSVYKWENKETHIFFSRFKSNALL